MKNPNDKRDWLMPDGSRTTSFKKHTKAWRDLYRPVELEFGMRCTQYCPGAMFILEEDGAERTEPMPSIALPTWFLIKLAKVCEQAAECRLLNDHMAAS